MSEYQYYEFQAIDRPLTNQEMQAVRALSTRAQITSTSFVNVYHWGSFRGDPQRLIRTYYDAFLYVANWGTRWLMFRLPRELVDRALIHKFNLHGGSRPTAKDDVVVEFLSDPEECEQSESGEGLLTSLMPIREDLLVGDARSLYLRWLLAAQDGELRDDATEPPVPPGLGELSGSLQALADFLLIDTDLIEVAARNSAPLTATAPARAGLAALIAELPASQKNELLVRNAEGEGKNVERLLLRQWRRQCSSPASRTSTHAPARRTVGELLHAAHSLAEDRRRKEAARRARAEAKQQRREAQARARYLDGLAKRTSAVWRQVQSLVATKQPKRYDEAVKLLKDLRDLSSRDHRQAEFDRRLAEIRSLHARKPSFIKRLDTSKLRPTALRHGENSG